MAYRREGKILFGLGLLFGLVNNVYTASNVSEILCSTVNITECRIGAGCQTQSVLASDAPKFLKVNLEKKTVQTIWQADRVESTSIKTLAHRDGLVLLQGVEPARQGNRGAIGWTISLDDTTGHMVVTASGHNVGHTIFGTCTTID